MEQYDPAKSGISIGVLVYSGIVAVLALLFVPAVSLTLSKSSTWKGVFIAALYLFLLFLSIGFCVSLLSVGAMVTWGQMVPYLIGFGIVFVAASMFPILVSRRPGVRLVNNRHFRERRNEGTIEPSLSDS